MGYGNEVNGYAITLNITTVNTTCQKENGKIIVQASGGVTPYDFKISGPYAPQPSGIFFGLLAGTYTVTVTDAVATVATQTVILTNTFLAPTCTVTGVNPPSGCSTFDAVLTLNGGGGLPPYLYSVDNVVYQTGNTFSNLTAGTYNYLVKDANGCKSIYNGTTFTGSIKSIISSCPIRVNGAGASLNCNPFTISTGFCCNVFGGTPPYLYSLDGINYQTSPDFYNLPEGLHTFWIKDSTGFIRLSSLSFVDYFCDPSFTLSSAIQPALCGINGSITITATDGVPPYLYSLDGINFQNSNQFLGLAPGSYTVTVKDSLNFISKKLAVVPNVCVSITATTTSSTCGNSNGKIQVQASGGTSPYSFSLDGINYSTATTFNNLAPGNQKVYVKDAIGNVATRDIFITNIAGPQITKADTIATGCDNRSGKITVTATNGTSPLSYSINSVTFQSSPIFPSLAQGLYTVTVKDSNGCTDTQSALITMTPPPPIVNLARDSTMCEGNTLLLNATNPNSTYLWQDNSTSATYLVNKGGQYFVAVSRLGCTVKDTINVSYTLKPTFSLGADQFICTGNTIILNPQLSNVSYLWQDGSIAPQYTVTQPGLYFLTAINTCGSKTDSVLVTKGVCKLYVPNAFTPNGDTKNDVFRASFGENITEFQLQVFNRYGQIVFESKDQKKGWDGNYKNSKQPRGSYIWLIQYKTSTDNSVQKLQGSVLLIH